MSCRGTRGLQRSSRIDWCACDDVRSRYVGVPGQRLHPALQVLQDPNMPASNRATRSARWENLRATAAANTRNSVVDWADQVKQADRAKLANESKPRSVSVDTVSLSMPVGTRPCTRNTGLATTCSCRECVLARWNRSSSADARAAVIRSPQSSSGEDEQSERSTRTSNADQSPRGLDARPFRGFGLSKAIDHFGPLSGHGPSMIVEARDLPWGGTEQTLSLDMLKLSVVEQPPPSGSVAPTEVCVTVYKRRRTSPALTGHAFGSASAVSHDYEVVYSSRVAAFRGPATTVALLDASTPPGQCVRGDLESVAAVLESAAQSYGTTTASLVEEARRVVPAQLGDALQSMC